MTTLTELETGIPVTGIKFGSEDAFADLYNNYAAALFGICIKLVRCKATAEDLLQEIFVKIWKHIYTYDALKGTLFTWMLNIARNTCIDYLRSKQHRQRMQVSEHGLEYTGVDIAAGHIVYKEESSDMQQFTQKLEPKYKEVIDLVYIYGYTQDEVSQMLNLPLGTVKTRCRMAIQQLRNMYTT
jgi:RNA polymerase sigma-70 factor, ECF subfamily